MQPFGLSHPKTPPDAQNAKIDVFMRYGLRVKMKFGVYQVEEKRIQKGTALANMVRPSGLEPPTPTMSRWCSNQLSYGRTEYLKMVRSIGLEPTTPTMSRWCSNQLSYERIVVLATAGTNISDTPRGLQGETRNFIPDFTQLPSICAEC
jgi:hypothetical protein